MSPQPSRPTHWVRRCERSCRFRLPRSKESRRCQDGWRRQQRLSMPQRVQRTPQGRRSQPLQIYFAKNPFGMNNNPTGAKRLFSHEVLWDQRPESSFFESSIPPGGCGNLPLRMSTTVASGPYAPALTFSLIKMPSPPIDAPP